MVLHHGGVGTAVPLIASAILGQVLFTLDTALAALDLAQEMECSFFSNSLCLTSCNNNFPFLNHHVRCILPNKESLGCVVDVIDDRFLVVVTCSGCGAPRRGEILR